MIDNKFAFIRSILFCVPIVTCVFSVDVTSDALLDLADETETQDGSINGNRPDCFPIDTGIPGPPGPPGDFGEIGYPGPKGADGLQGRDGLPGENYTVTGATGDLGERGPDGPKGRPGVVGRHGMKGELGAMGAKGAKGFPGEISEGSTEPGQNGQAGNRGKIGLPGKKGRKGEPGRDGNCTCAEDAGMGHFSAFSVARHDSLLSTDGDEIITWDHVFVNAIGDFAPESGIFTCCIPGYYFFGFNAHKSSSSGDPMVQLMLNGEHVASALEYGELDDEDSSSNSVVIHLDNEDQIWLQLYDSTGFYGGHYGYTTFLGYLLDAD